MRLAPIVLCVCPLLLLLTGCKREERDFQHPPPFASAPQGIRLSELRPGMQPAPAARHNPYEDSAYDANEGKRLFDWYNCSGCHFHGGGGIGPPLMSGELTYGIEPENVYATIVEGRPNGMPSFQGKIPDYQVWQLVAYVRSMSGQLSKDVAPSRSDHMSYKPAEQSGPKEHPPKEHPARLTPEHSQ